MMKALLRLRFQALFAGMTQQGRKKGDTRQQKGGKGTVILLAVLYLYVAAVLCGAMGFLFWTLAAPYHAMHLDWLYFAIAGTMGLGFSVFGSVFTTQNQLYDAKDNDQLLAMPIAPGKILLSRILPLMVMNLLFAAIVMVPATVVYCIAIRFSLWLVLCQILCLVLVCLLSQAIACILGWGLHLLLSKINKSMASILYTVLFLAVYFTVYPKMNEILASMAANGEAIADTLQTWVWPMFAMGKGALGQIGYLLAFAAISCAVFTLVYRLLSATFLKTATSRRSGRKTRLNMAQVKTGTASQAIVRKELRRFWGCPVYLTNMGIGLIMLPGIAVAGIIFRDTLLGELGEALPLLQPYIPLILCALILFCGSMICLSAPSISLEGKNLWILQSSPVSARLILQAKLNFHCLLSVPVAALTGLVLSIVYGCSAAEVVLCTLLGGGAMILNGLLGLLFNLKWPRFDWINEAYPCKQAAPVAISMFALMGLPIILGIGYYAVSAWVSPTAFLGLCAALFTLAIAGLYRLLLTWGVNKWNQL